MKPLGDVLHKADWFVGDIDIEPARRMIIRHHYAGGTSNTATNVHGLYRVDDWSLAGVAWWLPAIRGAACAAWDEPKEVLSLSRLVILPDVPKNAATFLLARSVRLINPVWRCLLTYADTWRNHSGTIYRAAGWEYLGLTKPERVYVIDGRMTSRKAGPKTRTHAEMLAIGAVCLGAFPRHRFRYVRTRKHNAMKKVMTQGQLFGDES